LHGKCNKKISHQKQAIQKNLYGFQKNKDTIINYYKQGIQLVWNKAKQNAFYRGVPFIWCSNNLTTSFAIQCYWYKQLTGDKTFEELEQANFDWLFGCNPWGTSMVYGLPSWGDTPADPHSAFTHLKNYPIDGGFVDGPVYGSIYNNLIGIKLYEPDEYANFQSELAVYHDDYGDYSTNEPTMDGTASLIYLLAAKESDLLVTKTEFEKDLDANITSMKKFGVIYKQPKYFIPPYEWWNDSISTWSAAKQMTLFSFTPGTSTNADYTYPELGKQYKTSVEIFSQVQLLQNTRPGKLNGMIILLHVGTDPRRTDKFYKQLPAFISFLQKNKYQLVTIDKLLR
jgi:hypothetical protein